MRAPEKHRPVLHHVNLKTRRMQAMIDWYCEVAGMTLRFAFPGGAWLSNDGANHRLAFLATPTLEDDPDKLAHTGLHHTAFEFADMDALLATATASNFSMTCLEIGSDRRTG